MNTPSNNWIIKSMKDHDIKTEITNNQVFGIWKNNKGKTLLSGKTKEELSEFLGY